MFQSLIGIIEGFNPTFLGVPIFLLTFQSLIGIIEGFNHSRDKLRILYMVSIPNRDYRRFQPADCGVVPSHIAGFNP